jgi:hypothetical protein
MFPRLTRIADNRLVILVACALFTLAMIYNWVFPLGALLDTHGIVGNDCGQMVWNIWHSYESIASGRNPYFTNLVYYPVGANLGHHTLAPGFFPFTFIVKQLSGGDPMYPLYTYRLIALLCFTLILYFSFVFLRELGLSRAAAATAAVGYSFSHFYMTHTIHINHLAGFLIPLTALVAVRCYRLPGKNLILLAFIAGVSVYFTEFSLYIYMAAGCFILILLLYSNERRALFQKLGQAGAVRLAASIIVFFLLVGPFALNLIRDNAMKPPPEQSSIWSGNLAGFIVPDPRSSPLYGQLFSSLNQRVSVGVGGFEMFLGFSTMVYAILALAKVRNRYVMISAGLGALFLILSLGGTLKVFDRETNIPMPYALLMPIPPFNSGRTPARFIVIGLFFLMIVAAFGLRWLQNAIETRKGARWSTVVLALMFSWSAAEVYQPIAKQPVFSPPRQLEKLVPGPVFELPLLAYDGYASLLQVFHHQPIVTGYLARISPVQFDHAVAMKLITNRGPGFCDEIQKRGYRNVIITPNEYMEPYDPGGVTQLELEKCSLPVIDLRAQGTLMPHHPNFVIREGREEPNSYPLLASHSRLQFSSEEADKYLWYGWSGREIYSHWTDCGKAAIVFSVDNELRNKQQPVKLRIFGGPYIVPGKIDSQRVTIEINDQKIVEWTINVQEPAVREVEIPSSILRDQNTLVLRLPDANSPRSIVVSDDWRLLGLNVQWIERE